MTQLATIAMARSGDKGAHANIGVWARSAEAFAFLVEHLTVEAVATHFAALQPRAVERYRLPNLYALNFVLRDVLGYGGASGSLRTDAQAKTYASALLLMDLEIPATLVAAGRPGTGVR